MISRNGLETMNLSELQQYWLSHMGWYPVVTNERKACDKVEESFWEKLAPTYALTHNLYEQIPSLGQYILSIFDATSHVLEIGPGSCNFTLPIAQRVRKMTVIEPSAAMMKAGKKRLHDAGVENVDWVHKKVEADDGDFQYDYVLSINSLYRVRDIVSELRKMSSWKKKEAIIVRSITMMPYYDIFAEVGVPYEGNVDDQIMKQMLVKMGYTPTRSIVEGRAIKVASHAEINRIITSAMQKADSSLVDTLVQAVLKRSEKIQEDQFSYSYVAKYAILRW